MESPPPLPPAPGAPPATPPPNWWQRNWKWFVPTGCLTMFLLFAGFTVCILMIVFGVMKSSDVYKMALARAKADSRVQDALGGHIHDGMFPTGQTNTNGPSGEAELAIPISGTQGKGTIYVVAKKSAGEWQFSKLMVKMEHGDTIDLLQPDDEDTDEDADEDDDDST